MRKNNPEITAIKSIAEVHRYYGLPKPLHPLVSIVKFEDMDFLLSEVWQNFYTDMYSVSIKKGESGKVKYGQTQFDFDEGIMTMSAPKQVFAVEETESVSLTGLTAQQHIHEKLIEKAKELLSTTNLSVSEIAYSLGFEFPQSFNKLFKNKTQVSPMEFRQSFR